MGHKSDKRPVKPVEEIDKEVAEARKIYDECKVIIDLSFFRQLLVIMDNISRSPGNSAYQYQLREAADTLRGYDPEILKKEKERDPLDDKIMPIGGNKGKRFKDIPLSEIDGLIGWLEEKGLVDKFNSLYTDMVEYLRRNDYQPEEEE